MKQKAVTLLVLMCVYLVACRKDAVLSEEAFNKENSISNLIEPDGLNTVSAVALTPMQQLGKKIFFDTRLSQPMVQSCASCHAPANGFTGLANSPTGGVPRGFVGGIGEGAVAGRFGARRPPSAAYATFSPRFQAIGGNDFKGGLFWDGRATGLRLGQPAAEQALGPFINPVEQAMHNPKAVLDRMISVRDYAALWQSVWRENLSSSTTTLVNRNYDRVGLAIAAYEGSPEVNSFSSKYDAFLRGQAQLTALEEQGLILFNNKAECYDCHDGRNGTAANPPVFTNFEYANIGVPKNPLNPVYWTNPSFIDNGLGGFLANRTNPSDWINKANANMGLFKNPGLRNVGKMKAFMHNGVFTSLEEVVHFYNTRDVPGAGWNGKPWGKPEVSNRIFEHGALGNLKLTAQEEKAIVAFMHTLTDGWSAPTATTPQ